MFAALLNWVPSCCLYFLLLRVKLQIFLNCSAEQLRQVKKVVAVAATVVLVVVVVVEVVVVEVVGATVAVVVSVVVIAVLVVVIVIVIAANVITAVVIAVISRLKVGGPHSLSRCLGCRHCCYRSASL